jgi:UDP-N-acetylmuramoyl-tripeptide--D-alanyl-D-alanine ligase
MKSVFTPPFEFTSEQLLDAVSAPLQGEMGTGPWRVTTDSREAAPGTLFVALAGDRFDGHQFVPDVLARGSTGAVIAADHAVAREAVPPGSFTLAVTDPLAALGRLARWVRRSVDVPVVGLTGSSGKTTTRDMIAAVLATGGPGLATAGNFNNLVGLPLTLLRLEPSHGWVALEMGMSAPGEIRDLARIAEPGIRLITNVAAAHLEFFADLDAVARAKGELFEDAHPGDVLITNADDPRSALFPRPEGTRELRFGAQPEADVRIVQVEPDGLRGSRARLSVFGEEIVCTVPLPGRHNVANAAAALAVGWAAGVPAEAAAAALAEVCVTGGRMQVREIGGVAVIDDSYNANPRSVAAALETLVAGDGGGRRFAVLGDMLELGVTGPELHEEVGEIAAALGVDRLMVTGPLGCHTVEGAHGAGMRANQAAWYASIQDLIDSLLITIRDGDRVLVKGSRGMRMERVIDGIEARER